MDGILYEKQDFHGWTEDKAWLTNDGRVEFDDGSVIEFATINEMITRIEREGF